MNPPFASAALLLPAATEPSVRQLTDAALMREVRTGNDQAFAVLVDRHHDALVNYLVYTTGSRARAEEIAQDSFIRAYQAAHRYDEQGRFSGWLFRIGINLARTDARRRSRWRDRVDRVRDYFASADPPTPDGAVRGQQEQKAVREALSRLPELYREAVVLREIEGWTYEAIAQVLDIAVGTAKSRVHRAKAMLQRELESFWTEADHA
jgi:RNA polymerase sigma-70 factor, ECF subfamily